MNRMTRMRRDEEKKLNKNFYLVRPKKKVYLFALGLSDSPRWFFIVKTIFISVSQKRLKNWRRLRRMGGYENEPKSMMYNVEEKGWLTYYKLHNELYAIMSLWRWKRRKEKKKSENIHFSVFFLKMRAHTFHFWAHYNLLSLYYTSTRS